MKTIDTNKGKTIKLALLYGHLNIFPFKVNSSDGLFFGLSLLKLSISLEGNILSNIQIFR